MDLPLYDSGQLLRELIKYEGLGFEAAFHGPFVRRGRFIRTYREVYPQSLSHEQSEADWFHQLDHRLRAFMGSFFVGEVETPLDLTYSHHVYYAELSMAEMWLSNFALFHLHHHTNDVDEAVPPLPAKARSVMLLRVLERKVTYIDEDELHRFRIPPEITPT